MPDKAEPIFDAGRYQPEPYTGVRLYFGDGTRKGGIWTGKEWWSEGRAVYPVRWQRLSSGEVHRESGKERR